MSDPISAVPALPPSAPEEYKAAQKTAPSDGGAVPRFSVTERLSHWSYALFFLVAFIGGVLMWLPVTREWLGGARHTFSQFHGAMGILMIAVPLLLFLLLDRRSLAADVREVDRWDGDDRRWFWAAVRGGTLRGATMPPQRRLNAGQKVNAVLVAAMALGFLVTGSLLLARVHVPAWLVSAGAVASWLPGRDGYRALPRPPGSRVPHQSWTGLPPRDDPRPVELGDGAVRGTASGQPCAWSRAATLEAALPSEPAAPSDDQAVADRPPGP